MGNGTKRPFLVDTLKKKQQQQQQKERKKRKKKKESGAWAHAGGWEQAKRFY